MIGLNIEQTVPENALDISAVILEDKKYDESMILDNICRVNEKIAPYRISVASTLLNHINADKQRWKSNEYVPASIDLIEVAKPKLVFLDMEMQTKDAGYNVLRHFGNNIPFQTLVVTQHMDVAIAGYRDDLVGVYDKSSSFEQFEFFVRRALQYFVTTNESEPTTLYEFVLNRKEKTKVNTGVVTYFAASDNYSIMHSIVKTQIGMLDHVHLTNIKKIPVTRTLSDVELSVPTFIRCHRSYLVNPLYIESLASDGNSLTLKDPPKTVIPIARRYRKAAINQLKKYKIIQFTHPQYLLSKFLHA